MNLRRSKHTKTPSAPNTGARVLVRQWWKARRPDSLLSLALVISVVAHAFTYWATPHFIGAWNAPAPARFDAVLLASTKAPSVTEPIIEVSQQPSPATAKPASTRAPRAPSAPSAKSLVRRTPPVIALAPDIDDARPTRSPNEVDALEHPQLANSAVTPVFPVEPMPQPAKPVPEIVAVAAPSTRTEPKPDSAELQFPSSINIDYKMTSSVANGVANLTWKRAGSDYEIDTSIQATGFFTSMFVGVFRQVSRGEVTSEGVRPNFFSLQRGDAGADTAEFNRVSKELKIIKHGETHLSPLPERMQDMQSFLFQMAHDAAELKPNQDTIDVQVTNARKVYQYKFKRIGEETVQTRLGALTAIHLKSEAADPEDVYEVWLSPRHFYMPIKLKFFMGRFPIEQVASSVRVTTANASDTLGTRK